MGGFQLIFQLVFNHGTVKLLISKMAIVLPWKSAGRVKNFITGLKLPNAFISAECSWWHKLLAGIVLVTYAYCSEEKTRQQR